MITNLELENFKCFREHQLPLRDLTVLVGRNNAGKSTLVEALRLISIVADKYQHLTYHDPPSWSNLAKQFRGVSPSLEGLRIELEHAFYKYGDPPAVIRATFGNHSAIEVRLGPQRQIHAVVRKGNGDPIANKRDAAGVAIPLIAILPQIGPLNKEEIVLQEDYVSQSMSTYLACQHFRNELKYNYQHFGKFRRLAEATWHGLKVEELEGHTALHGEPLGLLVRDGGFTAEVAWMGHGLQMWLQVMWFLSRVTKEHTIILDEPDVYMHADLQRKLVRELRGKYRQAIIATHSIEMMAEVEPENVVVVDFRSARSDCATSLPAVQRVVQSIGGVHNLQLARLWNSKKCILVEGGDLDLLRCFQNVLSPGAIEPIATIPHLSIGGWGGWRYAIGSSMLLRNSFSERIRVYCVLDRDYNTDEELAERYAEARERGVDLHIWRKKEIENYLLVPTAIRRVIAHRLGNAEAAPTIAEITAALENAANSLHDSIFDALSSQLSMRDRQGGTAKANRLARKRLRDKWGCVDDKLGIASGKQILSSMCEWAQKDYGVSISARLIASQMTSFELAEEVRGVLRSIERGVELLAP